MVNNDCRDIPVGVCPQCGYCPTCGRPNYYIYWQIPYSPNYPPFWVTCDDSGTPQNAEGNTIQITCDHK